MHVVFCLYLVLLLLRPQEVFSASFSGIPILGGIAAMLIAGWAMSRERGLALPQFLLAGLFVGWICLTVGVAGWWGGIPSAFFSISVTVSLIVMASLGCRGVLQLRRVMFLTILCALILVAYANIQVSTGIGPVTGLLAENGRPYYVGIFKDPNDLGVLFLIGLAFSLSLMTGTPGAFRRVGYGIASIALFYGVFRTNSRGDLIAAMALIGFALARRIGWIGGAVVGAIGLAGLSMVSRVSQITAAEESANNRIQLWYEGLNMLREHPIFGVGFGNYENHAPQTAHNSIVLAMAELGVPGLMLWLGIIWYSIRMLRLVIAENEAAQAKTDLPEAEQSLSLVGVATARGLLYAFLAVSVASFFLSNSYKFEFFLLSGLAMGSYIELSTRRPELTMYRVIPDVGRLAILAFAAIVSVYVAMKANI